MVRQRNELLPKSLVFFCIITYKRLPPILKNPRTKVKSTISSMHYRNQYRKQLSSTYYLPRYLHTKYCTRVTKTVIDTFLSQLCEEEIGIQYILNNMQRHVPIQRNTTIFEGLRQRYFFLLLRAHIFNYHKSKIHRSNYHRNLSCVTFLYILTCLCC